MRTIVRLRLAVDKPDEGGIVGHVEPVSESFSSRRADSVNLGHHSAVVFKHIFLQICKIGSGGGVFRSKRLAESARWRVKIN